ncbi:MAG: carboxypeptidase-like regulatory domain-containing protein [Bacteroidia bacterium]|nr:MAG: carboxypeptidase-like regulatory domain-containing protein [Bacteroidia bacterium]
MLNHFLVLAFTILIQVTSIMNNPISAQGVEGYVTDPAGQPIAFATVYIAELHHGTTANEDGHFRLKLNPGAYNVRFQYLGYNTQVHKVVVSEDYVSLDVVMEEQVYDLPVFTITAGGQDPAYYIMRRAISLSQYYLNQVSAYSCEVYLKGTGVVERIPSILRRQMEREGVTEDEYFVTETISEIQYQIPGQIKTRVISTRSSGDDNQTNPMAFVTMSLYRDINGIISPLSRSAFQVYRFQLEGSFMDDGDQVHKIRVIPRRSGHDLYNGHIFIREGSWNLHTVDLRIEQPMFSAEMRQVYNDVGSGVWMPVSQDYVFKISAMGFHMRYAYLASVSGYEITLNPNIDHDFYAQLMGRTPEAFRLERMDAALVISGKQQEEIEKKATEETDTHTARQRRIADLMLKEDLTGREVRRLNRLIRREAEANQPRPSLELGDYSMEIDDSARVWTANQWAQHRPVPLTPEELDTFKETTDGTEADTLSESLSRKNTLSEILSGGTRVIDKHWRLSHNGLIGLSSFDYNTVNGLHYSKQINLIYAAPDDRRFHLLTKTGWAFARNSLTISATTDYRYNPFRRAGIGITGGKVSSDFNDAQGINRLINTATTLFMKENPLKLYEKSFVGAYHETDIINGLVLRTTMEYSQRNPLQNNTSFSILNPKDKNFSPNIPGIPGMEDQIMQAHRAFVVDARVTYTHRHYYRLMGERKQMLYSNYPSLSLFYREGLKGLLGSDTRFRQLEASISHSFELRLAGQFLYSLHAGKFIKDDHIFTPDFKHFQGNETLFMSNDGTNRFRTINFYEYSTGDRYAFGHLQYSHGRIILKRLPLLNRTLIREKLFINALAIPERETLIELGYGLNQVGLLFTLEFVTGFSGGKHHYTGFRIGIPLGGQATIRM